MFMNNILLLIVLLLTVKLFAQDSTAAVLPPYIMKAVAPSTHTLDEIKKMKSFDSSFTKSVMIYAKAHGGSTVGLSYNYKPHYNYLRNIIFSNDDLFLKEYAVMQLNQVWYEGGQTEIKKNISLEKKCLQLLKPNDIIWALFADNPLNPILSFSNMYLRLALIHYFPKNKELNEREDYLIEKSFEYCNAIYNKNPYPIVRANALVNIIADYDLFYRFDKGDKYYRILEKNYSYIKSQMVQDALINYNPRNRLRAGKIIPKFSFPLIGSKKHITSQMLKGKYYLLQFWATWCAPCVGEIPKISEIYEKYKKSNFTILSISLDDSVSVLKSFWTKRIKMPWYNAILTGGYNNKFVKYFGITGVPVIVLIDQHGKILENISNLSKNMWDETIAGYLSHQ